MTGDQLLSDDESGWRDGVRRLASLLLTVAVLAGIGAGGMGASRWLEHRRAIEDRFAAVKRLEDAGGVLVTENGRDTVVRFIPRPADDEGFAALAWFKTVTEVEAQKARVSNDGLRHLAGLRELRSLNLSDAKAIDGRGLAHLRGLPWLRYLMLDATSVGDEGLEYLSELPELELVLLAGTKVTDAGLAKIRDLRRLHTLILNDTAVTAEGINGLRRSYPNIVVRWREAARGSRR